MRWLCGMLLMAMMVLHGYGAEERIGDAHRLRDDGNRAEAYTLYVAVLRERAVRGDEAAAVVAQAIRMLGDLHRLAEADGLLEELAILYTDDWPVLAELARRYTQLPSHGYIIAGDFQRGGHRGGGRSVSSERRDRVQAMQLYDRARRLILEQAATGSAAAGVLIDFADTLRRTEPWRLQLLTDFADLPDYEEGYHHHWTPRGREPARAPADATGNPVFFGLPASYADALNDGERWRALLEEAVGLHAPLEQDVLRLRAHFAYELFGVHTLQEFRWFFQRQPQEEDTLAASYALHTLKQDETIARLANGVQRFRLPADWQFLTMYETLAAERGEHDRFALERLATVHENRRQYKQAATYLETLIRRYGDDRHNSLQRRLDQIVKPQAQFETAPVFAAGEPAVLEYRFRNGREVRFTAKRVDMAALLADVRSHLMDNPLELDGHRLALHNIGHRILHQDQDKYLRETVAVWHETLEPRADHFDRIVSIRTPLQDAGAYLVKAEMKGGSTAAQLVWIESTVIVEKVLDGENLYFVADAVTGEPVADATIEFFGYRIERLRDRGASARRRQNVYTVRQAAKTDADGLAVFRFEGEEAGRDGYQRYQWLISATTPDPDAAPDEVLFARFAFLNFSRMWRRHGRQDFRHDRPRWYAITDRPIYRPEDDVQFKVWVRRAMYDKPDDAAEFAEQEFTIRIRDPRNEIAYEERLTTDRFGGLDSSWVLPDDAPLGVYGIEAAEHGRIGQFRVEEYRSPEFEVKVEAPDEPQMLGDTIEAVVRADYLFGAPVTDATVKVRVERTKAHTDFYPVGRWDWLYGRGYLWLGGEASWHPGWRRWGVARPWPTWMPRREDPPELVAETEQPIAEDGTVTLTLDTALAKAMHGDSDHRYQITAEVTDASRRTIVGRGSVLAARDPFRVFVQLTRGHLRPGEASAVKVHVRRPDGSPQAGSGTATLYRLTFPDGEMQEELVERWALETGPEGIAELRVRPERSGQYRLSAEMRAGDRVREGATIFTVAGPDTELTDSRYEELELTLDQAEYAPEDRVRLRISTRQADSTVLLFVRPSRGVYVMPEVLRIEGHTTEVEIPVKMADMPNFFVEAVTVEHANVHTEIQQVVVPPASRALQVKLMPSSERVQPGESVEMQVRVTDEDGEPVEGSVVVTVYDRAIEYISGGSNVPDILKHFWDGKRNHFAQGRHSAALWSGNLVPPEMTAWRAIGIFGHIADRDDDTPSPEDEAIAARLRQDGGERMFRSMQGVAADAAVAAPARVLAEEAPMDARAEAAEPDAEQPAEAVVRKDFADTAFWSSRLVTDAEGIADVTFTMPDNLTSWRARSWVMGQGTRVGEQTAEIVTTKNLLLRMQAPRFFVEKDETTLSAIVHNYFDEAKAVAVDLDITGDTLSVLDAEEQSITVPAGGSVRVDWRVRAVREGDAVIRMRALSDEESDAMQLEYPVYVHGMLKTESFSGVVRPDADTASITLDVPAERRPAESRLEVRYSPTLAGAMVDALPYLVNFPYGCTEQTLNRFLPTVITQRILLDMGISLEDIREKRTNLHAQEIGDDRERAKQWQRWEIDPVFDEDEVAAMVHEGVQRLSSMQNRDGGWGWFGGFGERSFAHTTVVVVRGLLVARENGAAIVPGILEDGLGWLRRYEEEQLRRLALQPGEHNHKPSADNLDANVHMTLIKGGIHNPSMTARLYADRNALSIYGKSMLGLALHAVDRAEERDMVIRNIEQVLVEDEENQTAWLELGNDSYWWRWYGSEYEAHAFYLKLLAATEPESEKAAGVVKYLLNNRRHATYWNSTRDTALCIEAMADYLRASGEDQPDMTVEILLNNEVVQTERITADNLFSFNNQFVLEGEAVETGEHELTVRRQGEGPVYFNAYLTNFTLEDPITAAGLEVNVQRKVYRLVRDDRDTHVEGAHGQAAGQTQKRYRRIPLESGDEVQSGDLIEVELELHSRNDYEYLVITDFKAAGFEAVEQRSGYIPNDIGAYVELRDNRVVFFARQLARGEHSVSYRLRAEVPGFYSALPATIEAMYAPELVGNSDEIKLGVTD